jgi:hypothetical protein
MKEAKLYPQPHTYPNGAGVPCSMGITVREYPEYVEIRRMRSDGRMLAKILLTKDEAYELADVLVGLTTPM